MSYKWLYLIISLLFCTILLSCRENETVETQKPETVCYYDSDEDGFGYDYDEVTHTLTISGKGEMQEPPYWKDISFIKHIVISDGITNISDYAFSWGDTEVFNNTDFGLFESVKISNSVVDIGKYAFEGCYKLSNIKMSERLKSIGEDAFSSCENLVGFNIPNSVDSIGSGAFRNIGVNEITFPNGITKISSAVCNGCLNLEKVTLGNSVIVIEDDAFSYCDKLCEINLPESLLEIKESAFQGCSNLNVTLPENLNNIGAKAFSECKKLEEITMPNFVIRVDNKAFFGCDNLKKVTIKSKNVKLGKYSFGYKEVDNEIVPIEGFTIKGYKGSTAEKYAEENGFKFVALD